MNAELEKIVDSVISNGELTDRSRELLMKKAEQLGVDLLDFELELESKIAKKKSSISAPLPIYSSSNLSNKEGDIKKCPSCGASVDSFNTKCADCGHEFRNIQSSISISNLFEILDQIEKKRHTDPRKDYPVWVDNDITKSKMNAISSFPIPNTKEDILEFLSMSLPQATIKLNWAENMMGGNNKELKNTWRSKCEQVIMKARFSMKDDKKTLEEIEHYAKQLKIK